MSRLIAVLVVLGAILAACPAAQAGIVGASLGTSAPPETLGGYTMTPFPLDPQTLTTNVTSVASPLDGTVDFSIPLSHYRVGTSWGTWSHGYLGDVYFTGGASSVMLSLPSQTSAFYLYAEPNPFATYDITITAQDGTSVVQSVNGSYGACGYGFYGTDGDVISSLQVNYTGDNGFAIGEFGIAGSVVPVPGAVLLGMLGLSVAGVKLRRRTEAS